MTTTSIDIDRPACRPPRWMRMTASRSMRMSDRRFRASDRWIVVTVAAWSSA